MRELLTIGLLCTATACGDSKQADLGGDVGGGTCEEADRVPLEGVPEADWAPGLDTALIEYEATVGLSLSGEVLCHSDAVPDGAGTLTIAGVSDRADMELVTYEGDGCADGQMGIFATTTVTLDDWFLDAGLAPEVPLVTSVDQEGYWARVDATESTVGLDVRGWERELHVEVEVPPSSDETESGTLPGGVGWESRKEATRCTLDP